MASFAGHRGLLTGVAVSPDGTRIATSSRDRTVKLWRTSVASEPVSLWAHADEVWAVAFSPDGQRLATGGKDRIVVVHTIAIDELMRSTQRCAGRELSPEESQAYLGEQNAQSLPEL